jgi:hypothetical protein
MHDQTSKPELKPLICNDRCPIAGLNKKADVSCDAASNFEGLWLCTYTLAACACMHTHVAVHGSDT